MEFSSDEEVRKIPALIEEFVKNVLDGEEPFFISDEATIFDVSMASQEEVTKRCSDYYGCPVSSDDLNLPLWRLLAGLTVRRSERRGEFEQAAHGAAPLIQNQSASRDLHVERQVWFEAVLPVDGEA